MERNLLQQLSDLQERHGWLSDETLRQFAHDTGTPLYQLQAVTSFYPHYRRTPRPRAVVSVCRDEACHLARGREFAAKVRDGLAGASDVEVHEVSCLGRCEHAPAAVWRLGRGPRGAALLGGTARVRRRRRAAPDPGRSRR